MFRIPVPVPTATAIMLLASVASPSWSRERGDAATRRHCAADYMRFCAGLDPDGPEVGQCFARNDGRLSTACQRAIQAFKSAETTGAPSR